MPPPSAILEGLTRTANDWLGVAAAWHALLALTLLALAAKWLRPLAPAAAIASAAPLASVALFAWLGANPFNGTVFAVATVALVLIARRIPSTPWQLGPRWAVVAGALALAFGWVYPHFLESHPPWIYAFAAPLGLVPCPSLSVVLGLTLLSGSFGSRAWGITAGLLGLFYGLFGVLRLGVWVDVPLVVAAVATLVLAAKAPSTPPRLSADAGDERPGREGGRG